jgi:acyl transferase domain-containing protein
LIEPMLEEFAEVAGSLTYQEPKVPIVSNLTGEVLGPEQATDPAYWVRHAREPVRFADAIVTLKEQGAGAYVELGPDPVLLAMARECLGEEDEQASFVPTLREGRPEAGAISTAIAGAHASGAKLDWDAFFAGTGAKRVPLPTYPFQRKRYWLGSAFGGAGDLTAAGQASADHPMLGAAVELAGGEGDGLLLTGRLSLAAHPWLADHAVADTVLLSGAAFLELALEAVEQAGAQAVEELTLQAPLVLPETGAVAIQVTVSGPDEEGRREIAIHSRLDSAGDEELDRSLAWICHAQGTLSSEPAPAPERLDAWPPEGAEPLETEYLYDLLAEHELECGPTFQGLSAAWKDGERIYVEASLSEEQSPETSRFGIHPGLLGSALQGVPLARQGSGEVELASWGGVGLYAAGASMLRLRIVAEGEAHEVAAFDADGAPVLSARSVTARPFDLEQLRSTRRNRHLHRVRWQPVPEPSTNGSRQSIAILSDADLGAAEAQRYTDLPALLEALEGGAELPAVVIAQISAEPGAELPAAAQASAERALALAQAWVAEERLVGSRLTLVTERAVAAEPGEAPELAATPIWGLVRSAQSEHPDRFALIDTDGTGASAEALGAALALGAQEPQLALREGVALAPRLARVGASEEEPSGKEIDPERTVLVTGGLSGLGALTARHLVKSHGARRMLLVSRRGPEAKGAAELQAELRELGAEVAIAACDVTDRAALGRLFAAIPKEHPLGAIVHSAGALDDGVLESMDAERLAHTMRPKAEAAWHLHELSAELDLSQFLLFSSAAGLLGGAAQANYAAANSFLDALAALRHSQGLPATALAWGLWDQQSSLAGELQIDVGLPERMANQIRQRLGFAPMAPEEGLELFDAARELTEPLLAPVHFDRTALRDRAEAGTLAPILRGLIRTSPRREAQGRSLAQRLRELPEGEREAMVLDLVRSQVAVVLGHASAADVEPDRAFQEIGLDSLGAVELRNQLSASTGLSLAPTLVFDYPSAAALASRLLSDAGAGAGAEDELREGEIRELLVKLETTLSSLDPSDGVRERASTRLRSLLVGLSDSDSPEDGESAEDLASMSHEEMFELIDEEFGGE